jgi:hypothetical protein
MAHQIMQFVVGAMGFIGVVVFLLGFFFVVADIIDVYLRIRERVNRHDFLKRGDRE